MKKRTHDAERKDARAYNPPATRRKAKWHAGTPSDVKRRRVGAKLQAHGRSLRHPGGT